MLRILRKGALMVYRRYLWIGIKGVGTDYNSNVNRTQLMAHVFTKLIKKNNNMHHFPNLDLQLPKPFLAQFNGGAVRMEFHGRIVLCPLNASLLRSLIKLKSCV